MSINPATTATALEALNAIRDNLQQQIARTIADALTSDMPESREAAWNRRDKLRERMDTINAAITDLSANN